MKLSQIFISQFVRAGLVSTRVIGAGLVVAFGILGFLQKHSVDMTFHGLVPVALNSNKLKDGLNIHPSFSTILKDKTRGGILLMLYLIFIKKTN